MSKIERISKLCALLLLGSVVTARADTAAKAPPAIRSIVLVHGAFADGSSWDRVTPLLEASGYHVIAVYDPMSSLADDVAATRRAIERAPGPVLLVGHSYGGAVITDAGNDPKVVGLVYVAAFVPDTGESINDLGKGAPPPPWLSQLVVDSGGFASLPAETVASDFAQDLPAAERRLIAAKQGPIAVKAFDDRIRAAAWHTRPVTYVRAELDHMIDPGAQAVMAKRANARLVNVKASHVAMLSKPREVAAAILAAATLK
jgi:pimeloyl-ACP methyl ester carboxylesterase